MYTTNSLSFLSILLFNNLLLLLIPVELYFHLTNSFICLVIFITFPIIICLSYLIIFKILIILIIIILPEVN